MRINLNSVIHFSIDDVCEVFRWIIENEPDSIFDEPTMALLRNWNKKYGLCVDLYVFEQNNEYNICSLQDKYWKELVSCDSWLKIGWHQVRPGQINATPEEQLASIRRLYDVITNKAEKDLISRAIRLHRFEASGEVISALHKIGVDYFLTRDEEDLGSYDLTPAQKEQLEDALFYHDEIRNIYYFKTDIRLDHLTEGKTVDDILTIAKNIINRYLYKDKLEIFCHEQVLLTIKDSVERLFYEIPHLKKKLFFNTSAFKDGKIYFTACHNNNLYSMDEKTGEVSVVTTLLNVTGGFVFSSLIVVDDELWMIPCEAWNIYSYNIKENTLHIIDVPYNLQRSYKAHDHRKAVRYGRYIWLIPTKINALVRIDTKRYTVELFKEFPKSVSFEKDKKVPFKCGNISGDKLFLFADACSHNLMVDMYTGEISEWNCLFKKRFAYAISEGKIIVGPTVEGEPLRIYDLKNNLQKDIEMPSKVWAGAQIYAFWYPYRLGNYIFFMPHEARGIIRFNIASETLDVIDVPCSRYDSLREKGEFSVYDVLESDNGVIYISYSGAQCIIADKDGNPTEVVTATVRFDESRSSYVEEELYKETSEFGFESFLNGVTKYYPQIVK